MFIRKRHALRERENENWTIDFFTLGELEIVSKSMLWLLFSFCMLTFFLDVSEMKFQKSISFLFMLDETIDLNFFPDVLLWITSNDSFQVCSVSFDSALHIRENFCRCVYISKKICTLTNNRTEWSKWREGKASEREREQQTSMCAFMCSAIYTCIKERRRRRRKK